MSTDPADPRTRHPAEPPELRPVAGADPAPPPPPPRPATRPRAPWQVARRRRLAGRTISPDRLEQIRDRLLSGFYDTPEVRARVAERVRLLVFADR